MLKRAIEERLKIPRGRSGSDCRAHEAPGAAQIVDAALRALERGRVVEVVGGVNKMLVFMNRFVPRGLIRWFMGIAAKPPLPRTT